MLSPSDGDTRGRSDPWHTKPLASGHFSAPHPDSGFGNEKFPAPLPACAKGIAKRRNARKMALGGPVTRQYETGELLPVVSWGRDGAPGIAAGCMRSSMGKITFARPQPAPVSSF